jgi:hypothetical protein
MGTVCCGERYKIPRSNPEEGCLHSDGIFLKPLESPQKMNARKRNLEIDIEGIEG